jgi:hypothetical protein
VSAFELPTQWCPSREQFSTSLTAVPIRQPTVGCEILVRGHIFKTTKWPIPEHPSKRKLAQRSDQGYNVVQSDPPLQNSCGGRAWTTNSRSPILENHGEVIGFLLADKTAVRLPPRSGFRPAACLLRVGCRSSLDYLSSGVYE